MKKRKRSGRLQRFKLPAFFSRGFWAFIGIIISCFLVLSAVSFDIMDFNRLTSTEDSLYLNLTGYVGAYLAYFFLQAFGLGTYIVAFLILLISLMGVSTENKNRFYLRTSGMIVVMLGLFLIIHAHIPNITYGKLDINTSGIIGYSLFMFISEFINPVGTYLVAICMLIAGFQLISGIPYETLIRLSWKTVYVPVTFVLHTSVIVYLLGKKIVEKISRYVAGDESDETQETAADFEKKIMEPGSGRPEPDAATESAEFENTPGQEPKIVSMRKKSRKGSNSDLTISMTGDHNQYELPSLELLLDSPPEIMRVDKNYLSQGAELLVTKLADFGIHGEVTEIHPGPVVTMFEFRPAAGVKISKISGLADDLSLALSAQSVRIVAPIPGKDVVGIEIPNRARETVYFKDLIADALFRNPKIKIPIPLGKDIFGNAAFSDLTKMPHLLIAGTTGSGKSVFINSFIGGLLYRFSPDRLKMIMVDPKTVEFAFYNGLPHLLLPVVTDPMKVPLALKWAVDEMEKRYKLLSENGSKNIESFNQKVKNGKINFTRDQMTLFEKGEGVQPEIDEETANYLENGMPYILIIIDELADLMMVCPKDVEILITRLAQKARAAGIHLVLATQRPSIDVITGLIKANFPSRISFRVSSRIDSRTILDMNGAEKLLGNGDQLFKTPALTHVLRCHGAKIEEEEIERVAQHWKEQGNPDYREEILEEQAAKEIEAEEMDDRFEEAVEVISHSRTASTSFLQRKMKIGYNRAARIMDIMEAKGMVGPSDGTSRPREVLIPPPQ